MKKIIQRTRRFEKSFGKLNEKTQKLFIKKLGIFIDDEYFPSLRTHKLKGKRQNEYAFSVTDNIRAIIDVTGSLEDTSLSGLRIIYIEILRNLGVKIGEIFYIDRRDENMIIYNRNVYQNKL